MANVFIDADLCIGSGDCARMLPDAFEIDELAGISTPLPGASRESVDALARAARACPTNAIRVVASDGTVVVESAG